MNSALAAIYNIENSASDAVIQLEGISQIGTTIAKNSDVIAHNTAATAYYAEKNAELTKIRYNKLRKLKTAKKKT